MYSSIEFESRVKVIYEYVCESGIKIFDYKILTPKGIHELFVKNTHEGFKRGQILILDNLILIEQDKTIYKTQLKSVKIKADRHVIQNMLKVLDVREQVFRKLADSIAWQLIGGHHYIARRLYQEETYPSLLSKGIEEVKGKVDKVNSDPYKFALISDITSFVQVGDIVNVDWRKKTFSLIEVKSGKMNNIAFGFLKKYDGNIDQILENEVVDENLSKQIKRIIKQEMRRVTATNLIANEGGINPVTGNNYRTIEGETKLVSYNDVVIRLMQQLDSKDWAYGTINYGIVDTILHIGAYKGPLLALGKGFIENIIKESAENYIIFPLTSNLYVPISPPLFVMNIPNNIKFDLFMGRATVYLGLNLDNLLALFEEFEVNARWLSTKETEKFRSLMKTNKMPQIFIHKNRAIGLKFSGGDEESILGEGIISRILSDNVHPYAAVQAFIEMMNSKR